MTRVFYVCVISILYSSAGSMYSVKSNNVVGGSNMQYGTLSTVVFLLLTFSLCCWKIVDGFYSVRVICD